jgi:hypothetical protein
MWKRVSTYVGLVAGGAFGYFGWGLLRHPATETLGTVLFLFPALLLGRGTTDAQGTLATVLLYGVLGLLVGALVGHIASRRHPGFPS